MILTLIKPGNVTQKPKLGILSVPSAFFTAVWNANPPIR